MKWKIVTAAVAVILLLGVGRTTQASVINGDFETGSLVPWSPLGSAGIVPAGFTGPNAPGGFHQALVTSGGGSAADAVVEGFLGLAAGALDALAAGTGGSSDATEGSAIKQTITVAAGDTLTFRWNFLTNEFTGGPGNFFNDFGFWSITDGSGVALLADTFSGPFSPSPSAGFAEHTGYSSTSYTFAAGGTYMLGFGVMDSGDTVVDSGLLIDNVMVSSSVIPEPASMIVWGVGGFAGLVIARRRLKKKAAA